MATRRLHSLLLLGVRWVICKITPSMLSCLLLVRLYLAAFSRLLDCGVMPPRYVAGVCGVGDGRHDCDVVRRPRHPRMEGE